GLLVALGLGQMFGIKIGHTLGIFAGSMTSTATLQATLDVMGNKEPSIGHSVAYPFGVIGPILCIYFMTGLVQPKFPPKEPQMHMGEITLGPNWTNASYDDLRRNLPSGIQVTMVRKKTGNVLPSPDLMVEPGDGLLVVAERQDTLNDAAARLGKLDPGRIVKGPAALDYIWVVVGKASVLGGSAAQLPSAPGFPGQFVDLLATG